MSDKRFTFVRARLDRKQAVRRRRALSLRGRKRGAVRYGVVGRDGGREREAGRAAQGLLYVLGEPGDERLRESVAEDELRADDENLRCPLSAHIHGKQR